MPAATSPPASLPLRLLVTGARGFIGAAVVRAAVARGHRVVRLIRGAAATETPGVDTAVVDLGAPEAASALVPVLSGCDAVVHCAASLGGGPDEHARDTVAATRHLVAAMGQTGVRRMALVSSFAVYDYRALAAGARLDETSPLDADLEARGPYAGAKLAQERLVQDAGAALDWRIVRPGLVYGPGRGWFYHLGMPAPGGLWLAFAGQAELPLIHVDSCARAIVAAAEAPAGRVMANLVDDARPTRLAYMRALADATAPGTRLVDVPWGVLSAGGRVANALGVSSGMLHPARLAARCKPLTYDNAVARRVFDWTPGVFTASF